jgi:hypothetical protein
VNFRDPSGLDACECKVISSTNEAWNHYKDGEGKPINLDLKTQQMLLDSEKFKEKHQRIITGKTSSTKGNFSVDLTSKMFHVGRTNVDYNVECFAGTCTVKYDLFARDGFWDVDFVDEKLLGGLCGLSKYQADGKGPNLERMGGVPYSYLPATKSYTFKNPGYK